MRARHRHINKSLREASCCFDARFLTFANDAAIDSWTDLSSNARNATQSTAGARPTYKTKIQGGNGVARFDGGDVLETAAFSSPAAATAVMLAKANTWNPSGAYRGIAVHGYQPANSTTLGIAFCYLAVGTFEDWQNSDYLAFGSGYPSTRTPRAIGASNSGSDFRIISTVLSDTDARVFANGSRVSTRVETAGSIASFNRPLTIGGRTTDEFWNGDIGVVIYFGSQQTQAMMRRLERSAAFAYKISCN